MCSAFRSTMAAAALLAAQGLALAADGDGLRVPGADDWPRWQARLSWVYETDGARRDHVRGFSLLGDRYLTGSLAGDRYAGGLRATSGVLVAPRWQATGAGSLGLPGNGLALGRRMAAMPGEAADATATMPYLGIGYTGLSLRGGWGFSADLGVVAQPAGHAVRFGRSPGGAQNLDDAVRDLRLAPVLQLGVSYSF